MGGDHGPDSDSSGSEFRRSVPRSRSRSRRPKEARVSYSSRMSTCRQDPMPEYIDPELVKLIAQNAPLELDVLVRSLRANTKLPAEKGCVHIGLVKEDDQRSLAVNALLSSVRERNENLSASKKGFRHSCPERIWSDYDEEEEGNCKAAPVKRKRRKSLDAYQISVADRRCPSDISIRRSDNMGIIELRGASFECKIASAASIDQDSNCVEDECLPPFKPSAFGVSFASTPPPADNNYDMTNAKPWRHGMRKSTHCTKDDKSPESVRCKRKAEPDSRKNSEVRKYMETKELERRKEQQQLKAEADAAVVARKEQQRKLDLHRQALLQSHVADGKKREHTPRPAWVSEYSSLGEPPRPWSSSSSGEFNIYLPPPVTPPKLEPVPLDLYTTRFQYAERQPSNPRVNGNQVYNTQPGEKYQSEQVKGCRREFQNQLKYKKSEIMKAFPSTDFEVAELARFPVIQKAKWKAKTKPRGRKLSSVDVSQLRFAEHNDLSLPGRSADLEVYKKSLRKQFYRDGGSASRPAKAFSQGYKSTTRSSQINSAKSMLRAESCVTTAINDHVQLPSKVKRLKPTKHIITREANELTAKEIATLLNANRIPSDCESETGNGEVIAERMTLRRQSSPASEQELVTDLRKCVGHPLGGPQENMVDEDILLKWFGPPSGSPETLLMDEDVPWNTRSNRGHPLDTSLKHSRDKEVQLQVIDHLKEKANVIHTEKRNCKDSKGVVRQKRMHLLRSLAEQLVKRVNAACAKKCQLEQSVVRHSKTSVDSHLYNKSEPFVQLDNTGCGHDIESRESELESQHRCKPNDSPSICVAGSFQEKKSLESELEFLPEPKQKILHCGGLTELEQAGCEILPLRHDEMRVTIKPNTMISSGASMSRVTDYMATAAAGREICARVDWDTTDEGRDITCNIPSACSSFGSSSPSTGSTSPVILPTSAKYHMGKIKHNRIVSNEVLTKQSTKEDWTLPTEKDMYSIINVYTQHWKSKNREKVGTSAYPHIIQSELEDRPVQRIERGSDGTGSAVQENKPTCTLVSLCQKPTRSDFQLKSLEPEDVQTVQSTNCYDKGRQSPESYARSSDLQSKQNGSSSNFENIQKLQSEADQVAATPPVHMKSTTMDAVEPAGNSGLKNPEVTLVEIGDVKLCQSPTSFHLRLDRGKDNKEDRKRGDQKPVTICSLAKMGNWTEPSPTTSVGSKEEIGGQFVKNLIPPIKITYARRSHSTAMPDGGFTDDERVVVELHNTNLGGPTRPMQGDSRIDLPQLDASEAALTEGLTSPPLNMIVENTASGIKRTCSIEGNAVIKGVHTISEIEGNGALKSVTLLDTTRVISDVADDPEVVAAFEDSLQEVSCRRNDKKAPKRKTRVNILKDDCEEYLKREVTGDKILSDEIKHLEICHKDRGDVNPNTLEFEEPRRRQNGQCLMMGPLADQNKVVACEEEAGSSHAELNDGAGLTTEMAVKFKHNLKSDPHIDLQDSQEWELKLRRNQLEAELQRLDVQIMKTREKLQRSHFSIENRVQSVSSSFSGDQPIESSLNLHEITKPSAKQSATDTAPKEQVSDAYGITLDSQMQKMATSSLNPKSGRDVEKKNISSISYSDSFASEDTKMGQMIGGTVNLDLFADHHLNKRNPKRCGLAFRELKSGSHQFEDLVMGNKPGSKQIDAAMQMSVAQPYYKMPDTQDDFASEVSENNTERVSGRNPGRRSQVNEEEITGRSLSNARSSAVMPDEMVDLDVEEVLQSSKEVRKEVGNLSASGRNLLISVQDSAYMTQNHGKGPKPITGKVTSGNRGQASFQQNGRTLDDQGNSHNVIEFFPGLQRGDEESLISVGADIYQCGLRKTQDANGWMPWGGLDMVAVSEGLPITTGNISSVKQHGLHLKQGKDCVDYGDATDVQLSRVDGENGEENFCAGVPITHHLTSLTSENNSGGVPHRGPGNASQKKEEDIPTKGTKNFKSIGKSMAAVAAEILPYPLDAMEEKESCLAVVNGSFHLAQQISEDTVEIPVVSYAQCNSPPSKELNGQMATSEPGKVHTYSHDGRIVDGASSTIPQMFHYTVSSPVSLPCNSSSKEPAWENRSLLSLMDFSTRKENVRNNRLATNLPPVIDNWRKYQTMGLRSSLTSGPGEGSCGSHTVTSQRPTTHDLLPSSKSLHDFSPSLEIEEIEGYRTQAAKSNYPPACQENPFLEGRPAVLSAPERMDRMVDLDNQFCRTQGLTVAISSSRDQSNFLPPQYFSQPKANCNPSDYAESIISEDLENYDSDIVEDLQGDTEISSSLDNFEIVSQVKPNSSLHSNIFVSASPKVASCLDSRSTSTPVFHAESVLSSTNRQASQVKHVRNSSSADCNDQALTAGVLLGSSLASDMGKPFAVLQRHTQGRTVVATFTSPGTGSEVLGSQQRIGTESTEESDALEVITGSEMSGSTGEETLGSQQRIGPEVTEESNVLEVTMGSEVSGSTGEKVHSGASEIFIEISEPLRVNPDITAPEELNAKLESNEGGILQIFVKDAENHFSDVIVSGPPPESDTVEKADKSHLVCRAEFTDTTESLTRNPDMRSSSAICVGTTSSGDDGFQERVIFGDNLHCLATGNSHTGDTNFQVTASKEECLFKPMSGVHLESAFTEDVDVSTSDTFAGSAFDPRAMIKISSKIFPHEQSRPGPFCILDVEKDEAHQIPVQKLLGLGVNGGLPSHPMRFVQPCDVSCSVEVTWDVGSERKNSLARKCEGTGHIADEIHKFPNEFVTADAPECLDGKGTQSSAAIPSQKSFEGVWLGLAEVSHQGEEVLIVPKACAFPGMPTTVGIETSVSNHNLTDTRSENQILVEHNITKFGSNSIADTLHSDESIRGLPTSAHPVVPVTVDTLSFSESEERDQSQNNSMRPDHIIALDTCNTNTTSSRVSVLSLAQTVTDSDKTVHDATLIRPVDLECLCIKMIPEDTCHMNQISTLPSEVVSPSSVQVGKIVKLLSQHDIPSEVPSNYLNGSGEVLSADEVSRSCSIKELALPFAEDLEVCSSNLILNSIEESMDKEICPLMHDLVKEESKCCERCENTGSLSCKQLSISRSCQEETAHLACSKVLDQGPCCSVSVDNGPMQLDGILTNIRTQVDTNRVQRHNGMVDILTDMLYEDVLSAELSGFHCEGERASMSHKKSRQTKQTLNVTKTFTPKLKRNLAKVSEFCGVLKHFLPIGWRCVSVKHKTGSFLHVEGLRPHPLSSPRRSSVSGPLRLSGPYPCHGEFEQFLRTTDNPVLLNFNYVHSYVQRTFDPSPSNLYNSKNPVGEYTFGAVQRDNVFEKSQWQIDSNKLLSDLIDESVQKQFGTRLLVPSHGIKNLLLPAGGDSLVRFITNKILEHECYAYKHRFDIEKAIAKVFKDEHWERCCAEAKDVVGDLAQDIFCDLIEGFIFEMVKE